jgi:drug/metabolite transporter (DMT)-like permease
VIIMVFWAGNFIVVKGAIGTLPPVGFTFLRYCLAAATLLILLRWREGAIRLPPGDTLKIGLLGIIGFGCYQILWPVALQSIPAGDSALLIAATPVLTALLAVALGADALNPVKILGALVAFAGVGVVIAAGQGISLGASLVGDLLTIVAALCWAIYSVVGAGILRRHSPLVTTTWAIVAGTLFMAPLGIAQLATTDLSKVAEPSILFASFYAGTLSAGFANVIVFHAAKLLGPTRVTALQFLIPPLAVVMAAIFLAEPIRPIQVVGGVIILAGVALLRRGYWLGRRRPGAPGGAPA